jgi:hypothetical protein
MEQEKVQYDSNAMLRAIEEEDTEQIYYLLQVLQRQDRLIDSYAPIVLYAVLQDKVDALREIHCVIGQELLIQFIQDHHSVRRTPSKCNGYLRAVYSDFKKFGLESLQPIQPTSEMKTNMKKEKRSRVRKKRKRTQEVSPSQRKERKVMTTKMSIYSANGFTTQFVTENKSSKYFIDLFATPIASTGQSAFLSSSPTQEITTYAKTRKESFIRRRKRIKKGGGMFMTM